jgi:predicted metal-dependent hydrolase
VAIRVLPDSRVLVAAPVGSNVREIEKILLKRTAWILEQQENFRRSPVILFPQRYASDETCYFLGEPYRLRLSRSSNGSEGVTINENVLAVSLRSKPDPARVNVLVETWYRAQALAIFSDRIHSWFPSFEEMGLEEPKLTQRWMRTRWGTCSSRGKITLNTRLVMVTMPLIDYVIVHELCHLKEHNHGPGFHRLLASFFPDWKERRKLLGRYILQ